MTVLPNYKSQQPVCSRRRLEGVYILYLGKASISGTVGIWFYRPLGTSQFERERDGLVGGLRFQGSESLLCTTVKMLLRNQLSCWNSGTLKSVQKGPLKPWDWTAPIRSWWVDHQPIYTILNRQATEGRILSAFPSHSYATSCYYGHENFPTLSQSVQSYYIFTMHPFPSSSSQVFCLPV